MNEHSNPNGPGKPLINGKYDDVELAIMEGFADTLIGEPNINFLLSHLRVVGEQSPRRGQPYKSENELLADRGLGDLMDLFYKGSLGKNLRLLKRELHPNRVGYW